MSTLPGALTINNMPFSLTENLPETVPGLRVFGGTRPQVGNAAKSFILFYFFFFFYTLPRPMQNGSDANPEPRAWLGRLGMDVWPV